ncbi:MULTISPECIES: flavin reductase family protein [Streptomyces]|uniref:Flavin reductase family protein n=2 Tax=Streptomyces TaxID=1883 RepID=A0ABW6YTD9_9ACTN|nr:MULTISPECIES: flavin reductase family protein [Streptomyces]MCL3994386.1 flavin reductase family protein [Streptomyces lavenduligriseus]QIS69228.1 flavin reductase family protein [Streptomyces sp. DSM 40868]WDM10882.1 flavin reductase family protein [Streptomyces lavenduligriseus]
MTVAETALRSVLRAHPSGVAVLTARGPAGPAGVTITSFTSLSARPALVSFALADTSSTWELIQDAEWFGVQLLGAHQADLAERFATRGTDRFAPPTAWHTGPHGVPLLDDCPGWLVCARHDRFRVGDHHLVVAAVEHVREGEAATGLVHLHGGLRPVESTIVSRI